MVEAFDLTTIAIDRISQTQQEFLRVYSAGGLFVARDVFDQIDSFLYVKKGSFRLPLRETICSGDLSCEFWMDSIYHNPRDPAHEAMRVWIKQNKDRFEVMIACVLGNR